MRPTENDFQSLLEIANQITVIDAHALEPLIEQMVRKTLAVGELLIRAGETNEMEYFILDGLLRTFVIGSEGDEVTLGFYRGPSILSPSITRSEGCKSRVQCEALDQTIVIAFPYASLVCLMQANSAVQMWGDGVLRRDLIQRAKREWALATMSGADRLVDFRSEYVGMEQAIPHHMIASYLGVTPVTLSRLRNK